MATMPRPWQDTGWRSKEHTPRENPPLPHPPHPHPRLQHSRIHPTPHLPLPPPSPVQVGSVLTLNPVTDAPGGISRAPPGPAGGSRAPGQALPIPTHGASWVPAPLWQFPGHGQHQQLPRFVWQLARTINTQLFLMSQRALNPLYFFFL